MKFSLFSIIIYYTIYVEPEICAQRIHVYLILGQSKFLATYLSGKLCPLTPSQRPTNVEHLVVNNAPSASNLNLKGEKEFKAEQKSENRKANNKSEQPEATMNVQNGVSSEQKAADEQDMDSSSYCSIM